MKTILRSEDLSCPSCVSNIESALQKLHGVETAKVNFAAGKIDIIHDPEKITPEALRDEVSKTGYSADISAF